MAANHRCEGMQERGWTATVAHAKDSGIKRGERNKADGLRRITAGVSVVQMDAFLYSIGTPKVPSCSLCKYATSSVGLSISVPLGAAAYLLVPVWGLLSSVDGQSPVPHGHRTSPVSASLRQCTRMPIYRPRELHLEIHIGHSVSSAYAKSPAQLSYCSRSTSFSIRALNHLPS